MQETSLGYTGSYTLAENYIESGEQGNGSADVLKILAARTAKDDPDFEPMEAAASRLLGKIQRTGEYCSNIYLSNDPIAKYLLFGETDNCRAFMEYAQELIPDRVNLFSPSQDNVTALGVQLPQDAAERNGIIPALGLALSHNDHTPNFLYTYIERAVEAKTRKVNTGIIAAGLVGLMICAGTWFYFSQVEKGEIEKRTAIETQLAGFKTSVTQDVLNRKIADAKKQVDTVRQYADDYLSLAVMNEICTLTPENISIETFDADFIEEDATETPKNKRAKTQEAKKKHVKITGIVSAEFTSLESTLTGFVITLGDSPLFGDIDLNDKKVEQKGDSSILKFTAEMEIL